MQSEICTVCATQVEGAASSTSASTSKAKLPRILQESGPKSCAYAFGSLPP